MNLMSKITENVNWTNGPLLFHSTFESWSKVFYEMLGGECFHLVAGFRGGDLHFVNM